MSDSFKKKMITCFQAYGADQNANADPMTMVRWEPHEASLRTTCAVAKVGMVFDAKSPFDLHKERPLQTSATVNLVHRVLTPP